ncbi:hypothetical protein Clacol_010357 [Clathrus columnatus]|uniref:Uncharacterized protein n=1 Tax=Clathrus columnatus TaxID=1419009 RepID=A0AAV5ATW3_9AGAM|nr:hypothetical protein Clacol_010357 [Clathrus columnatus]
MNNQTGDSSPLSQMIFEAYLGTICRMIEICSFALLRRDDSWGFFAAERGSE